MTLNKFDSFFKQYEIFIIFFTIFLSICLLFLRNYQLLPMVMSDEYFHQLNARFLSIKESSNSNYIFNFIYNFTNNCGTRFYICAKFINIIFYVFGCLFYYLIIRESQKKILSFIIFFSILIGPLNLYTSYFVQESLIFFLIWFFSFVFIKSQNIHTQDYLKFIFFICFAFFIEFSKSYGVFLIFSAIIFLFFNYYLKKIKFFKLIQNIFFLIFAFFIIKFTFAWLLNDTFNFLSKNHEASLKKNLEYLNFENFKFLINYFIININGHFITLFSTLGIILYINFLFIKKIFNKKKIDVYEELYFFLLIFLIVICLFTSITNSISEISPMSNVYESIYRIHSRYYIYLLPILIFPCFILNLKNLKKKHFLFFFTIICIISVTLYWLLPYSIDKFDNPYLTGLGWKKIVFFIIMLLLILNLILFFFKTQKSIFFQMIILFPLVSFISSAYLSNAIYYHREKNASKYELIGIEIKKEKINLSNVLLVGKSEMDLYKILWHLDVKYSTIQLINKNDKDLDLNNNFNYIILVNFKENLLNIRNYDLIINKNNYLIYKKN